MSVKFSLKPDGVRDFLPEMAAAKRNLEKTLYDVFTDWGFEEVITPAFEYLETFLMGYSFDMAERIYKFFDRKGRVLALRPDMTTPIARIVANHYKDLQFPLRLCYFSNIFRFEEPRGGRQCEFYQAGAELIGVEGIDYDAEIIALAVEGLKKAGINEFKVSVGHTGFLKGILNAVNAEEEIKDDIHTLLLNKDFVGLKKLLDSCRFDDSLKELILGLTRNSGNVIEENDRICKNEIITQAIKELKTLKHLLSAYDVEKYISFDPALIRPLDYYTGIIFEVYSPSLGFPLCGGGRYDNLIEKFNGSYPATGFAFYIEGILQVLERQNTIKANTDRDYLICYDEINIEKAIKRAVELRNRGYCVELYKTEDREKGISYAEKKGFRELIVFEGEREEKITLLKKRNTMVNNKFLWCGIH